MVTILRETKRENLEGMNVSLLSPRMLSIKHDINEIKQQLKTMELINQKLDAWVELRDCTRAWMKGQRQTHQEGMLGSQEPVDAAETVENHLIRFRMRELGATSPEMTDDRRGVAEKKRKRIYVVDLGKSSHGKKGNEELIENMRMKIDEVDLERVVKASSSFIFLRPVTKLDNQRLFHIDKTLTNIDITSSSFSIESQIMEFTVDVWKGGRTQAVDVEAVFGFRHSGFCGERGRDGGSYGGFIKKTSQGLQSMFAGAGGSLGHPPPDSSTFDSSEHGYISSLMLFKMLKHGRDGVPMEVMGLMLRETVDEYTVRVVDVFARPQSETGVNVEAVDYVLQTNMFDMLKQTRRLEMVVGWYHSHPRDGCWLSGVDINTQQSFEALNQRAVAVVVDPIQSVKGKMVIDDSVLLTPKP